MSSFWVSVQGAGGLKRVRNKDKKEIKNKQRSE